MGSEKKEKTVKKDVKKQLRQVNFINVIAAAYVLYLAWQLISAVFMGVGKENFAMCVGGGIIFLLGGGWLLRREWRNFNRIEEEEEPEVKAEAAAENVAETDAEEEEYDVLPEEFMMPDGFVPPEGFVPPQPEEKNNETE